MAASFISTLWRQMTRKQTFNGDTMNTKLDRCLNTLDLTFLGIGQMVGAGIFVLTGTVIRDKTGPAVFLSYAIAGFTAFLNALSYAELASRFPKAGSAYTYTYVIGGEFVAFVIGWSLVLEYVLSVASVARGWSSTVDVLANQAISNASMKYISFPKTPFLAPFPDFLAAGIILAFCIVVILGPKLSVNFNTFITVINLAVLLVTTITMYSLANPSTFAEESKGGFLPYGFGGVLSGTATCFYAYLGFDGLAICVEEAKNPRRSMPISMALSVGIVSLLFIMASSGITLFQPWYEISRKAAFSAAFEAQGMIWAKYMVGIGSLFGISASLFTSIYTLPRLVYAMANDGLLFTCFSYVLPSTQVPLWSIVIFCPICGILAVILDIKALADFLSIGTLIAFSIVNVNVLVLRYKPKDATHISEDTHGTAVVGALRPKFQNIPLLKELKPGRAVQISLLVFVTSSLIDTIMILRGMSYIGSWWMILLLTLFTAMTLISVFVIAIHQHDESIDTYKLPGVPYIPCFCISLNGFLIVKLKAITWVRYFIWVFFGLVIYFLYSRRYSRLQVDPEENHRLICEPSTDTETDARNSRYVKLD